jgi:hypothetical protein
MDQGLIVGALRLGVGGFGQGDVEACNGDIAAMKGDTEVCAG